MSRLLSTFVLVIGFLLPHALAAKGPLTAEESAINTVIQAQLDAFRRHDAKAAFSYAAPGIQAKFRTAENFISMVATQYLPLYSPKRVEFLGLSQERGGVLQRLKVLGPDDREYVAYYPMERQPDGSWRIGGCFIEPAAGFDA
ncbi:MAG: DUF4864 domain-containing protein [Pseudomonadota bacterium]